MINSCQSAFYDPHKEKKDAEQIQFNPLVPFVKPKVPTFPVDAIPNNLRNLFHYLTVQSGSDIQMAFGIFLGILGGAFQKKWKVMMNGDHKNELVVQTVISATAGNGKSTVFEPLIKPIREYQDERRKSEREMLANHRREQEKLAAKANKILRDNDFVLASEKDPDVESDDREDKILTQAFTEAEEMYKFKLIMNNATAEAIEKLMKPSKMPLASLDF